MKKVTYQILISLLCWSLINIPVFAKSNTSEETKDSTKTKKTSFSLFSKKPKNTKSEIIITKSHKSIDLAKFISEFEKNKTRILGEDHIKAQSIMLESIKKLEEEIKTLTEPEKKYQKEKRLSELKTLIQNDIAIELDSESKEIDPIIKCNLLYIGNSKASLIHTLLNFLDSNFKSQFIFGKNTIPGIIKQNPKLEEALNDLLLYLTTVIEPKGSYEASLSTLLKEVYAVVEQCPQFSTDSLFQKFGQYIHGMKEFYKAQIAKNLADQIIERIKPDMEDQLQKKTRGIYYGSNIPISTGPASVKISSTTSYSEEATDGSFFEVSCSNKYTISVNVGFQKLLANFGVTLGWELASSALMFSIYEVIDTGQLRTSILSGEIKKEAKKGVKLRKEMQLREKQLLAIFPQYIEGLLKMVPIIPLSVPLEWPKITKVKNQESRTESNKFIEADLSLFDMLGFTVKYSDKSITYNKFQEFSSFITPDCYPAEGYTADSINKFFGQKYNLFDKYMNEKNNEYGITIILGDLRKYINALTNLAQNSSDKDAKNTKHEIENRWIGKKLINSEGRKGVFKSMLVTLMNLRMKCKTDREIELCSQAYIELERLSQLQEFAKGTHRADFALSKKTKAKTISGEMNVSSYGINFQLDTSLECPHISENGVFLSCKLILPLATAGIMSIKTVQEVLNKCGEQLRGKDKNNSSLNLGNAFQMIATDGISLLGSNGSVPFISSILTGTPLDVIGTTFITFNLRKTQTEAIGNKPLPDSKEMIKTPASKWVMQYVEIMSFSNYGADLSVLKTGINLGDRDRIFGTGTLSHILQKYCVFRLGIKKGEKNSPLKVIEDQQAIQILGMFTNIADKNSNIRYELQNLYNQVLEGINSNNPVITNFSQLIIDFLKNCDTLNNSRQTGIQPSLYEKTLLQFNEIMEYYFEYVFTPYRDKAFALPDSDI